MVLPLDDEPVCALCFTPCTKALGAHRQMQNKFWGGTEHGTKIFYTLNETVYFCSEGCRTDYFFGF